MNKRNLKIFAVLGFIGFSNVTARVFQTPESLERGYAFNHYPFARADYEECKSECKWLYVDIWGAGLHKNANSAFGNCDSTKKYPLSDLFFGASTFLPSASFVAGTVVPASLVSFGAITPNFDYNEDMAIFGAFFETRLGCDEEWALGFRARVPFRSIKVALDSCCELEKNILVNRDLFLLENEWATCPTSCNTSSDPVVQQITDAYALRLDLASALNQQQAGVSLAPFEPLVQYSTENGPNTTISTIVVTDANANPVYLIYSPGALPTGPFSMTLPQVQALPFLNSAGTNTSNARFETGVNYAALAANPTAQANFWIAPTTNTNAAGTLDVVASADFIRSNVEQLLQAHSVNNLALTSVSFLLSQSINFDTARNSGIGNFDTEFYARYDGCIGNGVWFAEGIVGARYPTDTLVSSTNQLLLVPVGNNRHYEVKVGGYLGIQPCEWLAIKADAWYFWALRHQETLSAPFVGATVANIGPGICGDVSWQYFVGDIDFTFLVPCACDYIGFDVGYQAWVKSKDNISLNCTSATDFFGVTQPLNSCSLENNTDRVAHTVKAEIFKQGCNWQIFAGWDHTFAGKNALCDTDWYLGLVVNF